MRAFLQKQMKLSATGSDPVNSGTGDETAIRNRYVLTFPAFNKVRGQFCHTFFVNGNKEESASFTDKTNEELATCSIISFHN